MSPLVRYVTDMRVGILGTFLTRRKAERCRAEIQEPDGPLEYRVQRRGPLRWDVAAYLCYLTSDS